jgi:hypothetical protein
MPISADELHLMLTEKGVETQRLGVFGVIGEQILGEAEECPDDDGWIVIKNPKRIIRLQEMGEGGSFRINFILIEWDLIVGGEIHARPEYHYSLKNLNEESQLRYLGLYAQYFEQKKMAAAARANIVIPEMQSPFGKVRPLK